MACLVCVCVPSASICPSKQSWQANLIWPGKGQPHSNCLSLTLYTDAPSPFFPSPLFLSSPSFPSFFCVIIPSFSPLFFHISPTYRLSTFFPHFPHFSWQCPSLLLFHHPLSLYFSLYRCITMYQSCSMNCSPSFLLDTHDQYAHIAPPTGPSWSGSLS